jgi:purine-binding chemotaxis protein CheW
MPVAHKTKKKGAKTTSRSRQGTKKGTARKSGQSRSAKTAAPGKESKSRKKGVVEKYSELDVQSSSFPADETGTGVETITAVEVDDKPKTAGPVREEVVPPPSDVYTDMDSADASVDSEDAHISSFTPEKAADEQAGKPEDTSADEFQLVCFSLGNEEYGVDINRVQEINRIVEISSIPDTAPYVKGVINLRGRITPVLELRALLGLPKIEYDKQTRIIVLDSGDSLTGLVVDNVTQVLRIRRSQIAGTPDLASTPGREFLKGIYNLNGSLILVLDCDRALNFK